MAVIEDNWDYRSQPKNHESDFESCVSDLHDEVLKFNGFRKQNYDCSGQSHDEELKMLVECNKELRLENDSRLVDLDKKKNTYETFKKDQKLLSQEIKDTHESFLMAKKYYKKYLKIYYTVEKKHENSQTIFLQFFTEVKKEHESFSVRLLRDTKTESYKLMETNPKLENIEDLKKLLQETNDVPGILYSIRQAFLLLKNKK